MNTLDEYIELARKTVIESAQAFHLRAVTESGLQIEAPMVYQIEEPGFRPFRGGKAAPEELQVELNKIIELANTLGIELGIEGVESLRKIALQMGLGIDCSNFTYRTLDLMHARLNLKPYAQTLFRLSSAIREFHQNLKPRWDAKDAAGNVRELTTEELQRLTNEEVVDAAWITEVFGKDSPVFIIGSQHIAHERSTVMLKPDEVLPGDLLAFTSAKTSLVAHVGNIEQVEMVAGSIHVVFWHAWHTRGFDSGLRRDSVSIEPSGGLHWSHEGLQNSFHSDNFTFRRPRELAKLISTLQ